MVAVVTIGILGVQKVLVFAHAPECVPRRLGDEMRRPSCARPNVERLIVEYSYNAVIFFLIAVEYANLRDIS